MPTQRGLRPAPPVVHEVIRFVVVGAINTAFYYGLYRIALLWLPYLAAHLLAWGIAMVGSFFLNCWFTYRVQPSWRRFLLFPMSNVVNFAMTTLAVSLLVGWLHVDERVAPLAAALLAIPATFVVAKLVLTSPAASGPIVPRGRDEGPAHGGRERT